MIKDYSFGKIKIKDKEYENDVEVRWDGEILEWWRDEGHKVKISDLERALEKEPDFIVIGIGSVGKVKVKDEPKKAVLDKDIKLVIDKTPQAVKAYNKLEEADKKVIGLFHLTC